MTLNNEQINRVIANGKPLVVIEKLIKEELLRFDRAKFESGIKSEYDVLFPEYRLETDEEYNNRLDDLNAPDDMEVPKLQVLIDYSKDENYVTFEQYKNETKVIQEAVEATYDDDGIELTPAIPEVKILVRPYIPLTEDELESKLLDVDEYVEYKSKLAKDELNTAIEKMTVIVSSGKEFDANELARINMMSAVISAEFAEINKTKWKLANNEIVDVTVLDLKEAVMLSLAKFGTIKGII